LASGLSLKSDMIAFKGFAIPDMKTGFQLIY